MGFWGWAPHPGVHQFKLCRRQANFGNPPIVLSFVERIPSYYIRVLLAFCIRTDPALQFCRVLVFIYIFFYRPPTRLYLFTLLQMRFSGTSQDGEDYLKPDSLRFTLFINKSYTETCDSSEFCLCVHYA